MITGRQFCDDRSGQRAVKAPYVRVPPLDHKSIHVLETEDG
jgi:hypothetical protein